LRCEFRISNLISPVVVQDVPNPPNLHWVECNSKDAVVVWEPRGDNRAPILTYKIQYNTSFIPDTWETATGNGSRTICSP
jgi:neuronal cell adhesion protein